MKRLALALGGVALALVLVWVALLGRGRDAMQKSDDALAKGELARAIVFAERAAQSRVVGSPYPARGYDRLFEVAERERTAQRETARAALRAVLTAARTSSQAGGPEAARARSELATLVDASNESEAVGASGESDLGPSNETRLVLGLSVVLLVGGLAAFARGLRPTWSLVAFSLGLFGVVTSALQ